MIGIIEIWKKKQAKNKNWRALIYVRKQEAANQPSVFLRNQYYWLPFGSWKREYPRS